MGPEADTEHELLICDYLGLSNHQNTELLVHTPFLSPTCLQPTLEEGFTLELQGLLRQTFTCAHANEEAPVCLMDSLPLPFNTYKGNVDFLVWTQQSLRALQCMLGCLMRLPSILNPTPSVDEEYPERRLARLWYEQFSRLDKADAYTPVLRLQIQQYILRFPILVYEHVSHFPSISFQNKVELLCLLCFSACKIFAPSFWNPDTLSECPGKKPSVVLRFHHTWYQALYRRVLAKACEGAFVLKVMDAYQRPVVCLLDHYRFASLLRSSDFHI
jgi:hypothetical protein